MEWGVLGIRWDTRDIYSGPPAACLLYMILLSILLNNLLAPLQGKEIASAVADSPSGGYAAVVLVWKNPCQPPVEVPTYVHTYPCTARWQIKPNGLMHAVCMSYI